MMSGWDRLAPLYQPLLRPVESLFLRRWRRRAIAALPPGARVLEVGAGPGMNSMHYPPASRVVLSDRSIVMALIAGRRSTGRAVVVASAEDLPFRDRTFGAAVATLVFCAVADDHRGLRELHRVTSPGGSAVFLEHVRPRNRVAAAVTDLLERLTRLAGEHVNRRTADNVAHAGFSIDRIEHALGTLLIMIVAKR